MPNDYFVSLILTYVPVGIAAGLTWLASLLGVVIDTDTSAPLTLGAVGLVVIVYYAIARLVEVRWPLVGQLLLSLGFTSKSPTYAAPPVTPPPSYRRSSL